LFITSVKGTFFGMSLERHQKGAETATRVL
jgi:hypothetical protein